jgi:hypothetical protein
MLVSNTAFAGFGCGFCSASFPQALTEKQTIRQKHNSKILRKANPPLNFSAIFNFSVTTLRIQQNSKKTFTDFLPQEKAF